MKSKIVSIVFLLLCTSFYAQTKVGTVDSDYIIGLMPETKIVLKRAQDYGAKLDTSFNAKLQDYKAKVDAFKATEKSLTIAQRKTKIDELASVEKELQQYQKNGSTLMQIKQNELMRPLYKKLSSVIEEVAKANSYTQILTIKGNEFAYVDPAHDITKKVMDKMGIKEPEPKKEN